MLSDLRFALRLFAKSPGFTAAAIAVLALGIGLNTAIFSVTYSLAFSPRPFADPDRIVQLATHDRKEPANVRAFSYPLYRDIAARTDLFSGVFAHNLSIVGVGEKNEARRSFSSLISANYFATLGVRLLQGRAFTPEEEHPGAGALVVIASHQYWRKTGFRPDLIGSKLRINERDFTIVGLTPEGFSGTLMLVGPELYFPLGLHDLLGNDFEGTAPRTLERADSYSLFVVARLADGVSREAAAAAVGALGIGLEKNFPVEFKDKTIGLGALPRLGTSTSPAEERVVAVLGLLLLGLAGAMLLVVCLNLAGLLLARGQARRKEFAIRLALGGNRGRLIRQLCVEGLVLALAGAGLGLLLTAWSTDLIASALSTRLPVTLFLSGAASPAIIAASLTFSMLATLFFALGPALKFSRADVLTDLKAHAGEGPVAPRHRWLPRHPLLVAQIALSLALLLAAGLFLRMAAGLTKIESGYRADHTLLVEVDSSLGGFREPQARDLYRAVTERLAALPSVQSASVGATAPYGFINVHRPVRRAGVNPAPDAKPSTAAEGLAFRARWNSIGADYFATLGLPVLRGRTFSRSETDTPGAPAVAIIDEELARLLWPDADALGQRLVWADGDDAPARAETPGEPTSRRTLEIVGIVRSTRDDVGQKKPGRSIYVPFAQGFRSNVFFHVRTAADTPASALALIDPVRRTVRETAPGLPIFKVQTFAQHLEANTEVWLARFSSALFVFFGVVSMIVAMVGIYGAKSYAVSRRTREIGIRMALGARPAAVRNLILQEGVSVALVGIVVGLLLGLGLGQLMSSVFVDFQAFSPVIFATAATAFALASLVACWLPAHRATRVDPMIALRAE